MTNSVEISAQLDFDAWVKLKQAHIEQVLDRILPSADLIPTTLHSAMRYSILGGGKRVRALLCYAAAEIYIQDISLVDISLADSAACALELMHAYSLVHDDMPCMDDDNLRRGKPSCHKQYDDATALLVGDSLQSLAFSAISQTSPSQNAQQQLQMLHILAKAAGSLGMAGGQAIDLSSVGKPLNQTELETMHRLKTGALIEAAVLIGAASAQSEASINNAEILALTRYAANIGLAFQVVDDILDVEGDSSILGKTAGKDANNNKPTYVTLLGLEAAKTYAKQLHDEALVALKPFSTQALRLKQLADFIMHRRF
jgi:farnesyl diphosphate synthase